MNEWLASSKYKDIWRFTDALIKKLVEPEQRKLQEVVDKLVMLNAEATGMQALAFTQDGIVYGHKALAGRVLSPAQRPGLAFKLAPHFAEFKKELDELANQKAVMRQVLALLYQPTHNLQELRDMTPECLVRFVEEFQGVPRFLNELVLVKSNERLVRQFYKTEPLFKLHAASHLFY